MARKRYRGADAWLHGCVGWMRRHSGLVRSLSEEASRVQERMQGYDACSMAELSERFRACPVAGSIDGEPVERVRLAMLAVLAQRTLGLRPYHVQLMGALALQRGLLAEMATGEGKTLAIALAAAAEAGAGRCCQVVTANDYLAARDAEEMGRLYAAAGVGVGSVVAGMPPDQRRAVYAAGVAYTTAKELMADHLRDRLAARAAGGQRRPWGDPVRAPEAPILARRDSCIVDEADHVLIDEAVTPLIVSAKRDIPGLAEVCSRAGQLAAAMQEGTHYRLDKPRRGVELTKQGKQMLEFAAEDGEGFWGAAARREEFVLNALRARHHYRRDHQYLVRDGKIVIIDEFTGRTMADRTWSQGLHQAVEEKEGLAMTAPTETLARTSFQSFFRAYPRLAGLSGTVRETARECWAIYHLTVVPIPPNRRSRRRMLSTRAHAGQQDKERELVEHVIGVAAAGRPVLVGTRSVESSERLAAAFAAAGRPAAVLNARQDAEEAKIVAGAGGAGVITIATNMAGRGTDIRLGAGVAEKGGLHVVASEFNESARVDRQLFGRGARQGDPGSCIAFVSWDDELFQRLPFAALRVFLRRCMAVSPAWLRRGVTVATVRWAQGKAQAAATRRRFALAGHEEWLADVLPWE